MAKRKKKGTALQRAKYELFHVKERAQLLMFMGVFAFFGVVFIGISTASSETIDIEIKAYGSTGEEEIELLLENKVVQTYELITDPQNFTYG